MTSLCPDAPDMDDCKSRKKRCLTGPCVGQPYTQGSECPPGYTFNATTCQCEQNCQDSPDETCEAHEEFNYETCQCEADCYTIWVECTLVNGKSELSNAICPNDPDRCAEPLVTHRQTGPYIGISNVSIDFRYSPETCGISTRGCLMTYTADYFCNGTPDGLERSLSATIFGVDSQPRDAQAYLVPYPYPADCPDRSCWTLVTSAVNTNGRNIC